MAISRYNNRGAFKNRTYNYLFSKIFRRRGAKALTQYTTAQLAFPTVKQIKQLTITPVVWTVGQKYFKLANEYYGDPELWWIIAWYNEKPLETSIKAGDVIEVPLPLEMILEYLEVI